MAPDRFALTVLGSGTVAPTRERTAPAHWVEVAGDRILFDCGAGTLHRAATLGIAWADVTHVVLTHFHPDHWGELPALLFALRWGTEPRRAAVLRLIGPVGLTARLQALQQAFGDWVLEPGYPLDVMEIAADASHPLPGGAVLETCKTPHTDESLAYAVRHGGRRFVYTGDTGPSAELAAWAADCDLLLCECSLPEERAVPLHLTPARAGALAHDARARRLVLTHFYPVFGDTDPATAAAEHFSGPVVAARDGDSFTLEGERC